MDRQPSHNPDWSSQPTAPVHQAPPPYSPELANDYHQMGAQQPYVPQSQGGYQNPGYGQQQQPTPYVPQSAPNPVPIQHQPPPQTIFIQQQPPQVQTLIVGGCPACRVGTMSDDFTCCGICCAIFFFPIGLICCWAMREKRCNNCGATFG